MTDAMPNDQTAELSALYIENAAALVTWLRFKTARMTGSRFAVEDIAQEVWLRATTKHARFDPARSQFRTWLFGIAANVFLDLRTRSLRLARVRIGEGGSTVLNKLQTITDTVTSVTAQLVRSETLDKLLAEVDRYAEIDQKVFQLRGLEERPHAEVAELLGLSVDAVTKRWTRLLVSLQQHALPKGLLAE